MRKILSRILPAGLLALASLNVSAGCPRIISQSPYLTIALEWMERGDCIVGVSRYDRRALPRTGGVIDPDGAAIEKLRPDLIVTSNWSDADTMELVTPPGARMLRLNGFASLAGFDVVETAPKIRHLCDGEEIPDIAALVRRLKPAIVFSLSREAAAYCNAEIGTLAVRIVTLKGENFFHPGPRLLDGLKELAEQMK